jgi:hypothetical protein
MENLREKQNFNVRRCAAFRSVASVKISGKMALGSCLKPAARGQKPGAAFASAVKIAWACLAQPPAAKSQKLHSPLSCFRILNGQGAALK